MCNQIILKLYVTHSCSLERLPEEYGKCLVGLTAILREAWNTSQQAEDKREMIQALSLAKECYQEKQYEREH